MGATACIVVPWFADRHTAEGDWRQMAQRVPPFTAFAPYRSMLAHYM